ncbi:MAG: SCP2 sterol-binding domain-containing protein [Bacteroidota bacterium]
MDFQALVDDIKSRAAKVAAIGKVLKFDLDGDFITLDGTGDDNVVHTDNQQADCTIKVSKDNLVKVMNGSLNPMMAFMTGKVKVDGDMSVAMKLQNLV